MGREETLMSMVEIIIAYMGVPNDPIGWAIVLTIAAIMFMMIVLGILYMAWKAATTRISW